MNTSIYTNTDDMRKKGSFFEINAANQIYEFAKNPKFVDYSILKNGIFAKAFLARVVSQFESGKRDFMDCLDYEAIRKDFMNFVKNN